MFNSDRNENSPENSPENRGEGELVETWQRFVQGLLGVLALVGALVMAHCAGASVPGFAKKRRRAAVDCK